MRPYSPGGALTALAPAPTGSIPPAPSAHRLRRGLPGYLILFATHAFAPQCQDWSSWTPSPRVFSPISTHFTATQGIPPAPPSLKSYSFRRPNTVEPCTFTTGHIRPPTRPLRPMIPNNASPFRITAAAGTELAGASFGGTVRTRECILVSNSSSPLTGVYNPKAFVLHAALLRQAFAHCAKFPTAASRRSLARVSVPV